MPVIDTRLLPGQWRQERLGKSGRRYRLLFLGSRFRALSRMEQYDRAPGKPWYWRRIYTAQDNNKHPHGKLSLSAFEDIGITSKIAVAEFIAGHHVQFRRVD